MKKAILFFGLILAVSGLWAQQLAQLADFQLASPIIQYKSQLFQDSMVVNAHLAFPDARVFYTTDNSNPNENASKWKKDVVIKESTTLKIKAFHPSCQASDLIEIPFFKVTRVTNIHDIQLKNNPSPKYPGTGKEALFDLTKGSMNFHESAWMGFEGEDVEVNIAFEKKKQVSQITASVLEDHGSWIFAPYILAVWTSENGKDYRKVGEKVYPLTDKESPSSLRFLKISTEEVNTKYLKILIKCIPAIPDWHPGKGGKAWLFIDEILID